MEITVNIYARDSNAGHDFSGFLSDELLRADHDSDKKWIRCRSCFNKVALVSDKIEVDNTEIHIFENPSGIFFRIICYSDAPGSVNISEYTDEATWFPGYSWSITLCRSCKNHIGWHYDSGYGKFYGLIADRLAGL